MLEENEADRVAVRFVSINIHFDAVGTSTAIAGIKDQINGNLA